MVLLEYETTNLLLDHRLTRALSEHIAEETQQHFTELQSVNSPKCKSVLVPVVLLPAVPFGAGHIPVELARLNMLQELKLSGNRLTGMGRETSCGFRTRDSFPAGSRRLLTHAFLA